MVKPNDRHSLADYWNGIQSSIDARLSSIKTYLKHPVSGTNIETYFRDLLREYLPRRYAVETGFVVNSNGERSDQIDIVVADLHEIPPLSSEPLLKIFPAEAVVAAIEVTSSPKSRVKRGEGLGYVSKFQDDVSKLAYLRRLARHREYKDRIPFVTVANQTGQIAFQELIWKQDLAPRSFLITCGDEWSQRNTFESNLLTSLCAVRKEGQDAWVHAVFSMKHGMLWFKANTDFHCDWRTKHALLEFILFVNKMVSTYQTFRIDIARYRPTLPEAGS